MFCIVKKQGLLGISNMAWEKVPKKEGKKLNTTGKHGTMFQVFLWRFCAFSKKIHVHWGKNPKMLVFTRVYVCVNAKLTFLFFLKFF